MQSPINQPAENTSKVDFLNSPEVAGAGIEESLEKLLAILERKEERMALLKPPEGQSEEQLRIAQESVHDRYDLAKTISFDSAPRV